MGILLVLCTLIYILFMCNADDRFVNDGQEFYVLLNAPPSFGRIKECAAGFKEGKEKDSRYNTIINSFSDDQYSEIQTGEIILFLPHQNQCGLQILNTSPAFQGQWHVNMFNDNGDKHSETFNLTVLIKSNVVTNIEKKIGIGTLTCSKLGTQRSCRISNDKDLSFDKCEVSVIFREPSTWYCRTMNWVSIEESKETIHVAIEREIMPNVTVEETDVEFKFGCSLPYSNIPGCRAEYPDGKNALFIGDTRNLHHERYSTAGTDLENGYCSLTIKKPIADKEKGIWRIYLLDTSSTPSALKGCLLYVGDKKNLIQKTLDEEDDVRTIEVIKSSDTDDKELTDDTFELTCRAPFILDRCYLRNPSGRVHFQNEIDINRRTLGICTFRNLPKIDGSWICGLHGEDYEHEIIRKFYITVIPKEEGVINEKITAISGDSVDLLCRSSMTQPISECAFTNPQGKVYMLSNNFQEFEKSRISYFGKGLQNGYCGLKIRDITKSEFGNWTCQFSGSQKISILNIQVQELP